MPVDVTTTPRTRIPILSEPLRQKITALFPRYPSKRAVTLPALHMVQEHLRCVPHQAMAEIAELLEITPAEVHDTMSFYGFFPQAPIGDVRVWICRSLSCMLRGGDELLEHACKRLGIEPGETTGDGKLTVESPNAWESAITPRRPWPTTAGCSDRSTRRWWMRCSRKFVEVP